MDKQAYIDAVWAYLELEWPQKVEILLQLIAAKVLKKNTVNLIILKSFRKGYRVAKATGELANFLNNKEKELNI